MAYICTIIAVRKEKNSIDTIALGKDPKMTDEKENKAGSTSLREGPVPLSMHIGLAMMHHQNPSCKNAELQAMIEGVSLYRNHHFKRQAKDHEVIWRAGTMTLQYVPAKADENEGGTQSVFIVPSMINKSYVLDMFEEQSFVMYLAQQGMDVYLFDWGNLAEDPAVKTVDDAYKYGLKPALNAACGKADDNPVFGIGYCMGGTLLTALAQMMPKAFSKLVFLAAPWDFHAGDKKLTNETRFATPAAMQAMAEKGYLPSRWIQSVFATMNADQTIHKFARFGAMDQNSSKAKRFVVVEDWLNEGIDLPREVAMACLTDWFRDNVTANNAWSVYGTVIDPACLDIPCLVVASEKDRLVPLLSSKALHDRLPQSDLRQIDKGHIGMMTSRSAPEGVWKDLAAWLTA